jgi:transposase
LKALVLEQCAAPGASVAKVAMSHGVNANIVHGWRKLARERQRAALSPPGPTTLPAKTTASVPQFLPVSMAQTTSPPTPVDIQIEVRRGAATIKIAWPVAAAAECATWMRALFIESPR